MPQQNTWQRARCLAVHLSDSTATMTSHPKPNRPSRKKAPKQLAVIDPDCCTGCGACVEVCPVEAITKVGGEGGLPGVQWWYEVDGDRCIGCGFCVELPKKRSEVYAVTVCPWEAIGMVAAERRGETGQEIRRGNTSHHGP